MLKMFDELGTPAPLKQKIAFPEAGAHVIASYIDQKTGKVLKEKLQNS